MDPVYGELTHKCKDLVKKIENLQRLLIEKPLFHFKITSNLSPSWYGVVQWIKVSSACCMVCTHQYLRRIIVMLFEENILRI